MSPPPTIDGKTLQLDEDCHVHSTFSDGTASVAENIVAARACGLRVLGCVDHVRRDTTYVPEYITAVRAARETTDVVLTIGIECKLLDSTGELDLPETIAGVDIIYIADHQFPGTGGPVSPRVVRAELERGERGVAEVIEQLVTATAAGLRRAGELGHAAVIAHLFSIVPKLGLDETMIGDAMLGVVLDAAARTNATLEVSERWRCPSVRVVRAAMSRGIRVVASTDSHRAVDVGRYMYVTDVAAQLSK